MMTNKLLEYNNDMKKIITDTQEIVIDKRNP